MSESDVDAMTAAIDDAIEALPVDDAIEFVEGVAEHCRVVRAGLLDDQRRAGS